MRLLLFTFAFFASTGASADIVFDGIVKDVTIARTPIGNGLDAIIFSVDVGTDEFLAIDGGFIPLDGVEFNQNNFLGNADATPPSVLFAGSLVPEDDTTFLLTNRFGDPAIDGANRDTELELVTLSIGYATPITGAFELARLVVPTGGHISTVRGSLRQGMSAPNPQVSFISGGNVIGSISGSTTAVPEPSAASCLGIAVVLIGGTRRYREKSRWHPKSHLGSRQKAPGLD